LVGSSSSSTAPGVVAADLEQVGEEGLEALDLRVEELGGASRRRREVVTLVVQHVARETDRRERRAELVRDIGDEALLHPRHLGEPRDLLLQTVGHAVEGAREGRDDVFAALGDALLELAGSEALARLGGEADGGDDESHDEPGDPADEQHERREPDDEGLLHRVERLLRL
jgi:hypothetical protein